MRQVAVAESMRATKALPAGERVRWVLRCQRTPHVRSALRRCWCPPPPVCRGSGTPHPCAEPNTGVKERRSRGSRYSCREAQAQGSVAEPEGIPSAIRGPRAVGDGNSHGHLGPGVGDRAVQETMSLHEGALEGDAWPRAARRALDTIPTTSPRSCRRPRCLRSNNSRTTCTRRTSQTSRCSRTPLRSTRTRPRSRRSALARCRGR